MLRERKVWRTLRALENQFSLVRFDMLVEEVLKANSYSLPFMRFKDENDVMRTFQSLIEQGRTKKELVSLGKNHAQKVTTSPTADTLYGGWSIPFWWKLVDEFGFKRIILIIATVLGLAPGGYVWQIIEKL